MKINPPFTSLLYTTLLCTTLLHFIPPQLPHSSSCTHEIRLYFYTVALCTIHSDHVVTRKQTFFLSCNDAIVRYDTIYQTSTTTNPKPKSGNCSQTHTLSHPIWDCIGTLFSALLRLHMRLQWWYMAVVVCWVCLTCL